MSGRSSNRRTALAAAAAAVSLACTALIAVAGGAPASGAAPFACRVDYTTNDWGSGFGANLSITNASSAAVDGWTLTYSYAGNQTLQNGWNGNWSQTGNKVTVTGMSWNSSVPAGGTVKAGANFSYSGTNAKPADFAVNGSACTGTDPTTTTTTTTTTTGPPADGPAPALRVSGNRIVTAQGQPYRLLGVSRSSGEFACVQGKGMWDGGPVDQASVDAMKTWNIHAVRIPLNEECWLGVNGSPGGAAYQQAVKDYANRLVASGITVILDLHWTWGAYTNGPDWHCKDEHAVCQKPMPDAKYATQFWTGVATAFKGNDAVVFDLFNEPYPEIAADWNKTVGWQCWRDGGTCTGLPYETAGMQDLVDAVRSTGATNVLMLGGLEWANDMREWLAHKPADPLNNIAASWHAYSFNACASETCWDTQIAPLAAQVPVVLGEFGQDDCGFAYMQRLADWADAHALSYLAWTWNPWGCSSGAVLIKDWNGTPEAGVGEGFKAHLLGQDPYATR
ncbi:cellulase family glycosylhydrolase [Nocardia sp. NRRL S-836]|uniref:cellulase family glycosylhydrolase n=1 Tax=Nocardia sp. NRRL S-836 TaxID=1519492 RepID=UPI0006AEEA05|nr:cellulase family glycosylhydrolase [Nocardia sp. NRRL S-836]KOV90229.1 cellulose-binding protein [Nocardia sp. NRRL S-836]